MDLAHLIVLVMLVALMFGAGLKVDRAGLAAVLRNTGLLGRALLANIVLVPLYGVVLVQMLHLSAFVATGILLMAVAPGVPFLVKAGVGKGGGSVDLAATLAFFLPVVAVVTVPLTLWVVLPLELQEPIRLGHTLVTLVLFELLPLVIGVVVRDRATMIADRLERPAQFLFLLMIVVILAKLAPAIGKSLGTIWGTGGILAAIIIALMSLATGWFLGGPDRDFRSTLAIGTTLRNIGIALAVAKENFTDDGVSAAVLTYLVVQVLTMLSFSVYLTRSKKA
jgi:BASS family bile acid:Na+ symporter